MIPVKEERLDGGGGDCEESGLARLGIVMVQNKERGRDDVTVGVTSIRSRMNTAYVISLTYPETGKY